ncbi:MAG: hypothetical protein R2755_19145 [Acidimicrobiales bacterium]
MRASPATIPAHVPQRVLRGAPPAARRVGLRLPRIRPDGGQRHRRQAHRAIVGDAPRPALRHGARARAAARSAPWLSAAADGVAHPGFGHGRGNRSQRFVSLTRRTIAAISYELTPLDRPVYVAVQSDLLANEPVVSRPNEGTRERPPR